MLRKMNQQGLLGRLPLISAIPVIRLSSAHTTLGTHTLSRLALPSCAVMSTLDDRENVATALHLGAADYLVKPLRSSELTHLWTHVWCVQKT